MSDDIMEGFNEYSDDSLEKILGNLLDDENIEMKTEINNVSGVSVIKSLSDYLKGRGLLLSSKIIVDYLNDYLKYMVSYSRKGRLEIIDAVKGMGFGGLSLKDRMTKDLKDI